MTTAAKQLKADFDAYVQELERTGKTQYMMQQLQATIAKNRKLIPKDILQKMRMGTWIANSNNE